MQRLILSSLFFLLTAFAPLQIFAQSSQHQIGLIDMAHVFKNYERFVALTDQLKDELEAGDDELKAKVESGKSLQEQMKTFSAGSPEFEKLEGDLLTIDADIKKIQRKKQREFMRKEADIYREVYLEVADAVSKYAKYYNYTLIMRFDRTGVASAADPSEIVEGLNQQVLYHRNRDDLTEPILNYLNDRWNRSQQAANPASAPTTR